MNSQTLLQSLEDFLRRKVLKQLQWRNLVIIGVDFLLIIYGKKPDVNILDQQFITKISAHQKNVSRF